jgi:hypothetical protein
MKVLLSFDTHLRVLDDKVKSERFTNTKVHCASVLSNQKLEHRLETIQMHFGFELQSLNRKTKFKKKIGLFSL